MTLSLHKHGSRSSKHDTIASIYFTGNVNMRAGAGLIVYCCVHDVQNTQPTLNKYLFCEFLEMGGVGCLAPGSQRKGN